MNKGNAIQFFRLDEQGLAHIFGELEAKIMESVWVLDQASVQDVVGSLEGKQHYKTVMTVMNRLVSKGVLARRRMGKAYVYQATQSRNNLLADVVDRMVRGLLIDFRDLTLTQIVETMETVDPAALAKLQALIEDRPTDTGDGSAPQATDE